MANRTTVALVRELLLTNGEDYDERRCPSLKPFVDTANMLITEVIACAARKGKTLSTAQAEMLERWMACHYYVQLDQNLSSQSTGGASGQYQGSTAQPGVLGSKYGQSALSIDFTGCLKAVSTGARVGFGYLGKSVTEQRTFEERDGGS